MAGTLIRRFPYQLVMNIQFYILQTINLIRFLYLQVLYLIIYHFTALIVQTWLVLQ